MVFFFFFRFVFKQSIKRRLELHNAQRDDELCQQTPTKLSKKEKKKQKEAKKLAKQKKMDADKVCGTFVETVEVILKFISFYTTGCR